MTHDWLFILIYSVIVLPLWRWFSIWDYNRIQKRRHVRFLKLVKLRYPDTKEVAFVALETSDKAAMKSIMDQLEIYDKTEPEEEWPWRSG